MDENFDKMRNLVVKAAGANNNRMGKKGKKNQPIIVKGDLHISLSFGDFNNSTLNMLGTSKKKPKEHL